MATPADEKNRADRFSWQPGDLEPVDVQLVKDEYNWFLDDDNDLRQKLGDSADEQEEENQKDAES